MGRPQWVVPDYDLVMTYYLRSLDDMTKLTTSAGWAELEVGAEKIANVSIGQLVIGHEVVQFEDNWAESAKADA